LSLEEFGATDGVTSGEADWRQKVMALTDGWGVDVAVAASISEQKDTQAEVLRLQFSSLPRRR